MRSRRPRPRLPLNSDADLAKAYRHNYELCRDLLYDPRFIQEVGNLPVVDPDNDWTILRMLRKTDPDDRPVLPLRERASYHLDSVALFRADGRTLVPDATHPEGRTLFLLPTAVVTAFYVPNHVRTTLTLKQLDCLKRLDFPSRCVVWDPDEFSGATDHLEQHLEECGDFWRTHDGEDTWLCLEKKQRWRTDCRRTPFERQDSFTHDGADFVRWVPIHPYLPPWNFVETRVEMVGRGHQFFVEIARTQKELHVEETNAFYLDGVWEDPVWPLRK